MGKEPSHEPPTEQGLSEALRAAFESRSPDSVLRKIEELTGVRSRVLIHDDAEDPSPMLRVQGLESEPADDDSRYQVVGEIARGGVGVVHKARDRDLGRDVALKVLRRDFADNSQVFARFIEEAQIGGQLQHPGIVPVYGMALQPDGRPSFAMKLIKGRTLAAALKERKSPDEDRRRFLAVFEQVALTMGYAHARGVIHRDLKPSNILVGNFGEVLVVDWGFGKVLGRPEPERPETTIVATVRSTGEGSESLAGSVMGTPAYMPPEQALGQVEVMDEQSDVFALGSILTEILTGKPAYAGDRKDLLVLAAQAKLEDAFERLDECGAEPPMVDLAKRCLANLRSERPENAMAVAKEVGAHLTAAEERARKAELQAVDEQARLERETKQAAWERKARRKVLALAASVLVAVLVAGGAWFRLDSDRRSRAEAARPAVEQAMEGATRLGGQGKWTEAVAVARKAVALSEEADEETKRRAGAVLADAEGGLAAANAGAEQARKDVAFVAALRDATIDWGQAYELGGKDPELVAAFERWGIELDKADSVSAGERIRARGPEFASEVAAALDDLIWLRREVLQRDSTAWEPLVAMADAAAPHEAHRQLRRSVLSRDREALSRLASSEHALALPTRSQRLLGFGLGAVGEPRAAADFLRRALRVQPDDFSLLNLLGTTLLGARSEEAVRYFTAALALRPQSAPARGNLGAALSKSGRRDEALEVWRDALARGSADGVILGNVTEALADSGEAESALNAALDAARRAPEHYWVVNSSGRVLASEWLKEDRREALRARLCGAPDLKILGAGLRAMGRFREALEVLDDAIELDSGYAPAHYYRGLALEGKGDTEAAIEAYREAIRLDSGPASAWVRKDLAGALVMIGRLDDGLAGFGEAARLAPWFPDLYRNLGLTFSWIGRHDDAIEVARRMIRLQPFHVPAYSSLGHALDRAGRIEEAVEAYRNVVRRQPAYAPGHYNLANELGRLGRREEAVEAYREVLRLDPDHAEAHCNLGHRLREQGEFDEALASIRRGHEIGRRRRGWRYPSERWVGEAARMVEIERELPRLLEGEGLPSGPRELQLIADLCFCKDLFADAVRFHRDALGHPLAANRDRLPAARAAVRAGEPEQALVWLREQLDLARNQASAAPTRTRDSLVNWTIDPDLTQVRDEEALALLPPGGREAWSQFWTEVEALIEELEPDRAVQHYNLGRFLLRQRRFGGAVTALRIAVEERPEWADARKNSALAQYRMGLALIGRCEFSEALVTLRRSQELGFPAAVAISDCEKYLELSKKLPRVLAGEVEPADAAERAHLAQLLLLSERYVLSARFFSEALGADPTLASDPGKNYRYNAACAALHAALDDKPQGRWRAQALAWLRGHLQDLRARGRATVRRMLEGWLRDPDLASVREKTALARLPEDERKAWTAFWTEIREVLAAAKEGE